MALHIPKVLKILLGLRAIWPYVYFSAIQIDVFYTLIYPGRSADLSMELIDYLNVPTIFSAMALSAYFIFDVITNQVVRRKVIWICLIIVGIVEMMPFYIFIPIYWYLHIWRPSWPRQIPGNAVS